MLRLKLILLPRLHMVGAGCQHFNWGQMRCKVEVSRNNRTTASACHEGLEVDYGYVVVLSTSLGSWRKLMASPNTACRKKTLVTKGWSRA